MLQANRVVLKIAGGVSDFYIDSDKPLKAVRFLELALKALPKDRGLLLMLASAQRVAGLRNASIGTLKTALNVFPEDFIRWTLGVWLLEFGRPAEALEYFVRYLDNWADNDNKGGLANIYAVIGLCHLELKRWKDAEEFLNKSKELAFWDLDACIGLAALYSYTSRLEKVPALLNEYIQKDSGLYPPYYWMGRHCHSLRRVKDAIEWYQKALERIIDPDIREYCEAYVESSNIFDVLLNNYIDALIDSGQTGLILSAIQRYEKYKIGMSVESRKRLIDVYVDLGDFAQAEKFARSTPKVLKDTPEILSTIAHMEYKKGEIDRALNIIKQVLLKDDEYPHALATLGSIQMDNKMWDAATETYKLLLKRFPFVANWLKNLGLCYLNKNQIEKACEYYEEGLRYDELDADGWVDLGDIYAKLGNTDLALTAFQKALKYDWLNNDKRQQALRALDQLK